MFAAAVNPVRVRLPNPVRNKTQTASAISNGTKTAVRCLPVPQPAAGDGMGWHLISNGINVLWGDCPVKSNSQILNTPKAFLVNTGGINV